MLILTRKAGEKLVIGNDIVITIIENRGNKVRIGIEAPAEIPVNRKEIQDMLNDKQDDKS